MPLKTFPEFFQDSIDMTDGSITMTEKEYLQIQHNALLAAAEVARTAKVHIAADKSKYDDWVSIDGNLIADAIEALAAQLMEEKK